jgi:hypothetical protein
MNIKTFMLLVLSLVLSLVLFLVVPGAHAHQPGEASGVKILIIGATAKDADH